MAGTAPLDTHLAPQRGHAATPAHAGMPVAEGPLVLCPCSLQEHCPSQWPWQGLAPLLPCPWGASPPLESCHHGPRTAQCFSRPFPVSRGTCWQPPPGNQDLKPHPHSRLRPHLPPQRMFSCCPGSLHFAHACLQHSALALTCPCSEPFPRIPGRCLLCGQQPSPSSPAGTWHCPSPLQLAPAQARAPC